MNKFILGLLLIPVLLVGICAVSASSIDDGAEISVVEHGVDSTKISIADDGVDIAGISIADDGVDRHSDVDSVRSSTEPYEKLASILEKPKKDDKLASIPEEQQIGLPAKDINIVKKPSILDSDRISEKPKKDDRLASILEKPKKDGELLASGINEAPGMFGSDRISETPLNEIIRIDSILENQQRKELLATGIKEAPRILDNDISEKQEMPGIHAFGSIPESSLTSIPDIELLKSVYTPTNPTLDEVFINLYFLYFPVFIEFWTI